jgi:hypothetical protein
MNYSDLNVMEENTICSYEQWLKFRKNRDDFDLNKDNIVEFIETVKDYFIGFCLTPVFLYNSKTYTVKSRGTQFPSIEESKRQVIEFLNDNKNLVLYDIEFYTSTEVNTNNPTSSIMLRIGEVEV